MKNKNYPHIKKRLSSITRELKTLEKKGIAREVPKEIAKDVKNNLRNLSEHVNNISKNREFNFCSAKQKFFTTMGIEYTFLKRSNTKKDEYEFVNKLIAISDKRQPWNKKIHRDGDDVIELASPVHKNWTDMLSNYKKTVSYAKKVGLVCKRHDCGSGGGHIHMAIPKKWSIEFKLRFLRIFFVDISLRPYLNWIFNESIDDENANSMFTDLSGAKFILDLIDSNYFKNNNDILDSYSSCLNYNSLLNVNYKTHALKYDNEFDTIELRIFDMVENEAMLEDYVEFANAYFTYIYNIAVQQDSGWPSESYEINFREEYSEEYLSIPNTLFDRFKNKKKTIERFNIFLEKLHLNKNKYKKYIKKNYEARLKLNKIKDVKMDYEMVKSFDWPKRSTEYFNNNSKKDDSNCSPEIQVELGNEIIDNLINRSRVLATDAFEAISETVTLEPENPRPINTNGLLEGRGVSYGNENSTSDDPIQRLNTLSKIIAQEILINLEGVPQRGQKINISTTW